MKKMFSLLFSSTLLLASCGSNSGTNNLAEKKKEVILKINELEKDTNSFLKRSKDCVEKLGSSFDFTSNINKTKKVFEDIKKEVNKSESITDEEMKHFHESLDSTKETYEVLDESLKLVKC